VTIPPFLTLSRPEYSIYVGDLSSEITEQILMDTFARRYPSVIAAKVSMSSLTLSFLKLKDIGGYR
jgi:hypothetical protein